MIETRGNIWDFHTQGEWIVIPTNGSVRKDGACVMGRRLALQAKIKFPKLPYDLGELLKEEDLGNQVYCFPKYRIITFPVKNFWYEKANISLIHNSSFGLLRYANIHRLNRVYLPRVGCGNGKLDWEGEVKLVLEMYLDDKFIVVDNTGKI